MAQGDQDAAEDGHKNDSGGSTFRIGYLAYFAVLRGLAVPVDLNRKAMADRDRPSTKVRKHSACPLINHFPAHEGGGARVAGRFEKLFHRGDLDNPAIQN